MIKKFVFGSPVETYAVVQRSEPWHDAAVPVGTVVQSWPFLWTFHLEPDDMVFGLGENVRGINKRGFVYESWCSDAPNQSEFHSSLYGAHNFLIIYNKNAVNRCVALFFDTASRIRFDIGFTDEQLLSVSSEDTGINLYVLTPEMDSDVKSPLHSVTRQFHTLIGQSYIPPRWGFGFQQSRWGYKTEADVRTVVQRHREASLPLEAVCLDINYMEDFKDFTIDGTKFPDMRRLSEDLRQDGVHLVPIIDAGIKVQDGYDVYEEGVLHDYFCKKDDGSEFTAGVWPGRSHFPDFMQPAVREWFGAKYRCLTEQGIDGFWNDMNEPALFYSDEGLAATFKKIKEYEGRNLDVQSFFEFTPLSGGTSNRLEDYQAFYHLVPDGNGGTVRIRHDKIHNLYGSRMTQAAGEALRSISPERRMLLYSRSSCIGSHRFGGIWTGDNRSGWNDLLQEIKMLPSLNMAGYLYSGADIGGFACSASRDLVLRWLALGVFTPLMRNHAAWDARPQECYSFGDTAAFKSLLDLRYALIPYLYSEFVKAALSYSLFIRPLGFDYPQDDRALHTEDELLLGEGILIAPVYEQNAQGRYVYLPEKMSKVTWRNGTVVTEEKAAGSYYVYVPLDAVVFFVKDGCTVPLCRPARNTEELDTSVFDFVGNGRSYDLYEDDGYTRHMSLEHIRHLTV